MPITFAHLWPWLGLILCAAIGAMLAFGDLRSDRSTLRTRDMAWLAWAATAAYLLHQFEEHGIDAHGVPYAFRATLCATLGFPDPQRCAIPESFITAVNIPVVWLAGPISALLGRRWPHIALSYFSVPALNAVAHVGPALASGGTYNPGLLTALLLFVPLSLWTFRIAFQRADLGWRCVAATVASGVLLHAVLLGSLKAWLAGRIGEGTLLAIQVANPILPALLVTLAWRTTRDAARAR